MNRRDAIAAVLALGAAAGPLGIRAQEEKSGPSGERRIIGYLSLELAPNPPPTREQWRRSPIAQALRKLGWDEGHNLAIERAHANLNAGMLRKLAEGLVRKRVEVIITNGPEATVAAARATRSIPIVSFNLVWPEEQGLIDSLARPGRNVTGVSFYAGVETSAKRMEFLREVAPAAKRLSWIWPPDYEETVAGGRFSMAPAFESMARKLGFELRLHRIQKSEDIETALGEIAAWRAQALSASGEHAIRAARRIAEFALDRRLPSAFPSAAIVEAGGLLSYAVAQGDMMLLFNRSLEYVDRILRGARPADLPVERPSRYELVINLKTAKALGLAVPQALLLRADRVIR